MTQSSALAALAPPQEGNLPIRTSPAAPLSSTDTEGCTDALSELHTEFPPELCLRRQSEGELRPETSSLQVPEPNSKIIIPRQRSEHETVRPGTVVPQEIRPPALAALQGEEQYTRHTIQEAQSSSPVQALNTLGLGPQASVPASVRPRLE